MCVNSVFNVLKKHGNSNTCNSMTTGQTPSADKDHVIEKLHSSYQMDFEVRMFSQHRLCLGVAFPC